MEISAAGTGTEQMFPKSEPMHGTNPQEAGPDPFSSTPPSPFFFWDLGGRIRIFRNLLCRMALLSSDFLKPTFLRWFKSWVKMGEDRL